MKADLQDLADANNTEFFRASAQDFRLQAETQGWTFWRGLIIGFLAAFPIGYLAAWGFPGA